MNTRPFSRALAALMIVLYSSGLAFAQPAADPPPIRLPESPKVPTVPVVPKADKSLDDLLDQLEKLRQEKGVLEERERVLLGQIRERVRRQNDRLNQLGVKVSPAGRQFVIEDNEPARIPSTGKTDTTPPRIPAPGWPNVKDTAEQHFLRLVGDTAAGRKLFADVMEDEQRAQAVERAVADPSEAARQYVSQVRRLQQAGEVVYVRYAGRLADADVWERYRDDCRRAVPPRELTEVFFLGALADVPADADPGEVDHVLRATFIDLSGAIDKAEFRKLFAAWLDRRKNPKAVQAGLEAALYAAVPNALPTARKVAGNPVAPPATLAAALTFLGHYGGHEDLSLLSRWRDVAQPVAGGPAADGAVYVALVRDVAQVRDVAAAMSLKLRGRGSEEFGFPMASWVGHWFGPDRPPFETVRDVVTAAVREWAQTRAWEWLDKQPNAPRKPERE